MLGQDASRSERRLLNTSRGTITGRRKYHEYPWARCMRWLRSVIVGAKELEGVARVAIEWPVKVLEGGQLGRGLAATDKWLSAQ